VRGGGGGGHMAARFTHRSAFLPAYLYLHKNQLTGKIPRFFASNKSIKEMKLQENRFTGGISRNFGGMSNLGRSLMRYSLFNLVVWLS
jgi:hypothetical protein